MDEETIAMVARALAHPARVRIVRLIADQPECRGAEIFSELPLAQSTVSEHLRVLREAGVISSHAVGVGAVYCINSAVLREFGKAIETLGSVPSCNSDASVTEPSKES